MDFDLHAIERRIARFFEESIWFSPKSGVLGRISNDIIGQIQAFLQKNKNSSIVISIKIKPTYQKDLSKNKLSTWENFLKEIIIEEMFINQIVPHQTVQILVEFEKNNDKDYQIDITNSSLDFKKTAKLKVHQKNLTEFIDIPGYLLTPDNSIYEIRKPIINIGRHEDNDLVIDNLRVSRTHAQIRQLEGGHIIFDLDSTLGTKVNGERVTQKILSHGDVIELADVVLIYDKDSEMKIDQNLKRTRNLKTDSK